MNKTMVKRKKKILFFTNGLQLGGGEKVMVSLANYLAENGFIVMLATTAKIGSGFDSLSSEVEVVDLGIKRILFAVPSLVVLLRKERPDVVFSSAIHSNVILMLALKLSFVQSRSVIRIGSPLSVVFGRFKSFKDKIIIPYLSSYLYKKADVVVSVSKGIADDLRDTLKTSGNNIVVIYSPKNINNIKAQSVEKTPRVFGEKGPYILFVGRTVIQKDLPTLIEAFQFVRKEVPESKLIVVGDGNRSGLETEGVIWEGAQDNPYVYMKNSDVLVLPSIWEGLPNVLLESLICETPIVATDCPSGGPREILAPETDYSNRLKDGIEEVGSGYLVPMCKPKLMAEAILKSLDRKDYVFKYDQFSEDVVMKSYLDIL